MTTLKSTTTPGNTCVIEPDSRESDVFLNFSQSLHPFISINRGEFANAVRDLGFEVIDKAELPEVTRHGNLLISGSTSRPSNISAGELARDVQEAHEALALAAYLEANPPIDPKVEAFAEALQAADFGDDVRRTEVATDLVKAGYKITKEV